MEALNLLLLIFGPPLMAIVFAFLQLGVYLLLAKVGFIDWEKIPMFPFLIMRGLLILLGLIAVGAFVSYAVKGRGADPLIPTGAQP
jgi:hypothetical protein